MVTHSNDDPLDRDLEASIQHLDLPHSDHAGAIDRYGDVSRYLVEYWSGSEASGEIYPQGSIALGTVTKVIHRGDEYDLDAVCRRDLTREETTRADLKADVGRGLGGFVRSGPMWVPVLEEGKRCWTLVYGGHRFHLDVLPAIPDDSDGAAMNAILLTDKAMAVWKPSNPKDYAGWFHSVMQTEFMEKRATLAKAMEIGDVGWWETKTTLQRAVQALKRHRDLYFKDHLDDRPASIIITTLAARAYRGGGGLYEVLVDVTQRMLMFIETVGGLSVVRNPVQPKENFADRWRRHPSMEQWFFAWLEAVSADFGGFGKQRGADAILGRIAKALGEGPARAAAAVAGMAVREASSGGRLGVRSDGRLIVGAGAGAAVAGSSRSTRPVIQHDFHGDDR